MDYAQLRIRNPKGREARITSGELGKLDYSKLLLIARSQNESLGGVGKRALIEFIEAQWDGAIAKLEQSAQAQGMTLEDLCNDVLDR